MCPVSQADGHDAPRHLDQPVPVEATVPDDVVVASEHPVGQPVVAHELPDAIDAGKAAPGWVEQAKDALGRSSGVTDARHKKDVAALSHRERGLVGPGALSWVWRARPPQSGALAGILLPASAR